MNLISYNISPEVDLTFDGIIVKERKQHSIISVIEKKYIYSTSSDYDTLVYPLTFWNGKGGCGRLPNETKWNIRLMRSSCCSLLMQPQTNYIHRLSCLREEYLCSVYGRIMQYRNDYEYKRQMLKLSSMDIDSGKLFNECDELKEGIKTYIPKNLTNSPMQWKELQNHAFLLSVALGPPTFFITITCNQHWLKIYGMNKNGYLSNSALLMRVFRQKRLTFFNHIKKNKTFGKIKGLIWKDKFQQRGLSHSHALVWSDFDTDNPKKCRQSFNYKDTE